MIDWSKRIEAMKINEKSKQSINTKETYEYQKGYSDGYKEGYAKALEDYQVRLQYELRTPQVIVIKNCEGDENESKCCT